MAKKPIRDEALEALDFIINVLKEHEKDLDRLIRELGKTSEKFGDTGALSSKIGGIEERLSSLQTEISNIIGFISSSQREKVAEKVVLPHGTPLIVRCKQWEEFKVLASGSETVSFLFKETERAFQVDALKEGKVLTYSGEFPQDTKLLKIWLSKELDIGEAKIFEGALGIE
jgi:hypothetical protein